MKTKFFNLLMIVGALFSFAVISGCGKDETTAVAFLAPTTETNKVALLEDFTGVRCGYCPDGHVRAKAILDANPGKFIIIATNANLYAKPTAGWADFTTVQGTAIDAQAKPSGYPAGTMNRASCTSLGVAPMNAQLSPITMDRGKWATAASVIMAQKAPVNIGAKATYTASSRKLTVQVDLYYTSDETETNNINVALLQSHIFCKQSGGTPDPNNYEENHVLRDMITPGNFGVAITSSTKKGSKVSKTYTYTVPAHYNGAVIPPGGGAVVIDDLSVVVYVSRGTLEIINALEIDVK